MRNGTFFIILIVLVLTIMAVVVYQLSKHPMEQSSVAQAIVDVAAGKAVLVDVRRDDEWAAGHAAGAIHFELAKLEAGEMPDIPKDAMVYVYCAAGARAGKATELLLANGWTNVTNIGGLDAWRAAGGSV